MKRILAILLLAALLCLPGCGMVIENVEPKVIAVVSKNDGGAFWKTVLIGAEDAALENGYAITFRGPEVEGPEGVESQRKIVELALENDVCGMVMATVGPGFDDLLMTCHNRHIPVIQFDSGIFPRDLNRLKREKIAAVKASVYTNNREAAALNAEHLFAQIREDIGNSKSPYKIGIIQHDLTATGEERAQGFQKAFEALAEGDLKTRGNYKFAIVRCRSNKDNIYVEALDRLKQDGCRALFLTNQEVVNQVYDQIVNHRENYQDLLFTGFDSGRRQIAWLRDPQKPKLIGSVTQDPYLIGYHAVTQCINALEARGVTAFVEIPGAWYDLGNLEEMLQRRLVSD